VTDEQSPGERLDAALAALNEAFEELREAAGRALLNRADEIADELRDKLAKVSDRIDDARAEWGHDEEDADV
jgi:ABC-type transporter Mla subunit MlaD